MMFLYIRDFLLLAIFIIGLTAFMGILTHGLSRKLFGRKSGAVFSAHSHSIKANWKGIKRKNF